MTEPRSESTPARRSLRRHPGTLVLIAVLLAASLVATLWVPFYNRLTPMWGDFPFFYWYQLIWIPIVGVLSWLAYMLTRRTERAEAAAAGAPAASTGAAGGGEAPPDGREPS
jgi:Protein of unknown function (DUF3311)